MGLQYVWPGRFYLGQKTSERTGHESRTWLISFISSHPSSLKLVLISPSHLHLNILNDVFLSPFPTKNPYEFILLDAYYMLQPPVTNSDPELRSSGMVQCHVVCPSARPEPTHWRLGGAPHPVWRPRRREKFISPARNIIRFVCHIIPYGSHYSDRAININ
jgi:hypothetical protein